MTRWSEVPTCTHPKRVNHAERHGLTENLVRLAQAPGSDRAKASCRVSGGPSAQ